MLAVDTAQLLHTTAKHVQHDSQSPTLDAADGADASPADSTGLHVLVTVEYSGQAVALESLAANRDCLAVAGHSPIIRSLCRQDNTSCHQRLHLETYAA